MSVPDINKFSTALKKLAPPGTTIIGDRIENAAGPLFPEEEKVITGAVAKRRAEFTAGRNLARTALAELGCPNQPIARGKDRQPIWPKNFVGSISHSDILCAVIVATSKDYLGLGLDIEPNTPMSSDIYSIVLRPEEFDHSSRPIMSDDNSDVDRAKLIFSIKEAVFKALFPATEHFYDFQDARVHIDETSQDKFTVELLNTPQNGPQKLIGRWVYAKEHVIVCVPYTYQDI